MIIFKNISPKEPFQIFYEKYNEALDQDQNSIEAVCLSTVSENVKPSSRYVNIKYLDEDKFIFFSNYESNKSKDIRLNKNVALNFFWSKVQIQVRIEGKISKVTSEYSDKHWENRTNEKNALAIASNQSSITKSFSHFKEKYIRTLNNEDLSKRPNYWGGYSIMPNMFEFWAGHENRLNRREAYFLNNENLWRKKILEP